MSEETKSKMLVVDDEKSNVDLLKRTFRREYEVFTALNGFDALKILSQESDIAVIISDQRMPGLTGTEFLAMSLKTHPYSSRILLTAYTDIEAMIDGINKCDLFQYLNKPWNPDELKTIVVQGVEKFKLYKDKNVFYFTSFS